MLPNTPALVTSTSTSLAIVTVTSWNADTENESGGFVSRSWRWGLPESMSACCIPQINLALTHMLAALERL